MTPNYPVWVPTLAPTCPVRILWGGGGTMCFACGGVRRHSVVIIFPCLWMTRTFVLRL